MCFIVSGCHVTYYSMVTMTDLKMCSGAILTTNSAKGSSLSQYQFQTAYAGSSIFVVTTPAAVKGFNGPYSYGNASINAPSGYLG